MAAALGGGLAFYATCARGKYSLAVILTLVSAWRLLDHFRLYCKRSWKWCLRQDF